MVGHEAERKDAPPRRGAPGRDSPEHEDAASAVGGLLNGVLAELGIADKVRETQALLAWEEVAGPGLAGRARALRVLRGGKLELAVPSGVWRTHLSFSKQQLLERLNQRLGRTVIRDLVFVNRAVDSTRPDPINER